MRTISAGLIESWRGHQAFLSPVGQMHHRAIAIQAACDLESHLGELLSAFFVRCNPSVTHEKALTELYSDNRVLSSLRKMADVAIYLGLITDQQRYDLKKIAELRDKYAHGRGLKQLPEEPKLYELLTKTHLYIDNAVALAGLDQQAVFMCIREQLIAELKHCLSAFNSSAAVP